MQGLSAALLRWSSSALVATVWLSATLFGLYILAFYAGALAENDLALERGAAPHLRARHTGRHRWYWAAFRRQRAHPCAGLHPVDRRGASPFPSLASLAGPGVCERVLAHRRWRPGLHPHQGHDWQYNNDIGFALYSMVTILAAVQTIRHARAWRLDVHRAWALRLFALAIGSWLFHMDYGFWLLLAHGAGHTENFRGPFDIVMAFFFYIPNLLVAEAFIRARRTVAPPALKLGAAGVLAAATGFLVLGTYFFPAEYWCPAILHWIAG